MIVPGTEDSSKRRVAEETQQPESKANPLNGIRDWGLEDNK